MSDTQKTTTPTTNTENQSPSVTRVQDALRAEQTMDAMATEEIGSAFGDSSALEEPTAPRTQNALSLGLAAAFEQEEVRSREQTYDTPPLLVEIAAFVENFDWSDRSNITERFYQVQKVHSKIERCQQALRELLPNIHAFDIPAQKQKALTQLQQDLYRLQTFQRQSADFMDENRPTF